MKKLFGLSVLPLWLFAACASTAANAPSAPAAATAPAPEVAQAPIGLLNERALASQKIIAGGQPTVENLQAARAQGIKSVINLRTSGEPGSMEDEEAQVSALGMKYVSIPMAGPAGVTLENAEALRAALSADGATPAIVHCGTGNRVGALLAIIAFADDGLDVEAAMNKGKEAGLTHLEPKVREFLEAQAALASPAE